MKALVGIASYKRPEGLRKLLRSLEADECEQTFDVAVDVAVVDNDEERTAAQVVGELVGSGVIYLNEPSPGIVSARNKALNYAREHEYDVLAFIDDDEFIKQEWLGRMLLCLTSYSADVVCGPVIPVFSAKAPNWIQSFGFFMRQNLATGSDVRWPATNNVVVDLRTAALKGISGFDEAFSSTGGSDTDFFYRVREAGGSFVWCAEAPVYEDVPLSRTSIAWLWKRGVRLGNVSTRMLLRRRSKLYVASIALARLLAAGPLAAVRLVSDRRAVGSALMNIPKGIGMAQGVRGKFVMEYKRY